MTSVPNSTLLAFGKLPELLKQVIDHEENSQINADIEKVNGLTSEQGDKMMDVIRKVILKVILPSALVTTIQHDINLDEEKAKKLALDLLGRRFLPMQWYIGNVEGLIKELGGDVEHYAAEARKNYPEVYAPDANMSAETTTVEVRPQTQSATAVDTDANEPVIVRDIGEKLATSKGRAGVLLHLVGLSQQVEAAGKSGKFTAKETEELLRGLDALSYAVNTQDLNPLEIAAIKRRLKNILAKVGA